MKVVEIIEGWLSENNRDGLFNRDADCSCLAGDLEPCGDMTLDCEAGVKVSCEEKGCDEDGCEGPYGADFCVVSPDLLRKDHPSGK